MNTDDTDLIERIRAGETESFGRLVRRYQGGVQGLAYHVVGSFEDAEDIAQETFVTAYLKLDQLRNSGVFCAWLRQLTLNGCRMWMRKRRDHAPLDEAGELPSPASLSPAAEYEREETRRVVQRELGRLTDDNRLVIALYYLSGWNSREIAHFLDVPLSTVEGRMQRAKKQLRGRLMKMVEDTLREEKLSEEFTRKVLDQALEKAKEARKNWAKEDFVRFHQEASRAAESLDDGKAQIELHTMMGEAGATWLGNPENAVQEYESALAIARKHQDQGEEAKVLKGMVAAHSRHGEYDRMRRRAEEALDLFSRLGDRENEAQARAALDLSASLEATWRPGQPGGYAMSVFPVEMGAEGVRLLDPQGIRNYSWGCPSRCTAFAHLLRPRRLLGPDLSVGATWEDSIVYSDDGLSWGIEKECELMAKATVESTEDVIVTPVGKFESCLRVRTTIAPSGGGNATEHKTRSTCGVRLSWFAPGVGLVKLRHAEQNLQIWSVYLVGHEGAGGSGYLPLTIGRLWRYRWVESWNPHRLYEDTCRIVSCHGNVSYISSATRAVEQADEEVRSYFEKVLELERGANDLAGEAMALDHLAIGLKETEMEAKVASGKRLVSIYEILGDEWKLLEARWRLKGVGEVISPEEQRQWCEERLALARRLGDRRKTIKALSVVALRHRGNGEYDRAAVLFEEAAGLAIEEGDVQETSYQIASAELAREMSRVVPVPGVTYMQGDGYLFEKEDGRLGTKGSSRCSVTAEYPSGSNGTPMTDIFWNGPFSGIELLGDPVNTTSNDTLNTGIMNHLSESMRMVNNLVSKEEKIEVPAGEFSGCALIETTISTSGEDRQLGPELERIRNYYRGVKKAWFAPGVGLVRLLYQHSNRYTTDIQLVQWQTTEPSKEYLPLALNNRWRYQWTDQESGTTFEDSLRVASHQGKQWNVAFVTRATAGK